MNQQQGPRKRRFNQTEPITSRLRDLVRSYPKGLGLISAHPETNNWLIFS